jgi:hypothetical protein
MSRAKIRRIRKAWARRAFALATYQREQPRDYLGHELVMWAMDMIDERAGVR